MANPYHHAVSSARKHGGAPEDYQAIHDWFDATKAHVPGPAHRAMRHHSEGIALMESIFGPALTVQTGIRCSNCRAVSRTRETPKVWQSPRHEDYCEAGLLETLYKQVPVRWIGEQHVLEDFGWIPTMQDFLMHLSVQPWMVKGSRRLSVELERMEANVQEAERLAQESERLTRNLEA